MTETEERKVFEPTHVLNGVPVVRWPDPDNPARRGRYRTGDGRVIDACKATGKAVPLPPPAAREVRQEAPPRVFASMQAQEAAPAQETVVRGVIFPAEDAAGILTAATNVLGTAEWWNHSATRLDKQPEKGYVRVRLWFREETPAGMRDRSLILRIPETVGLTALE